MPVLSTLGSATAKAWGFLQQISAAADPYFNYVTMLLTGNGTNGAQNNTFLDSSSNAFSITRNGNATQGSFSPYGSLWSNYFDGNGDYLSLASNAAFGYGSGDFTIEMWFNCQGNLSNIPYLLDCRSTSTASELVPTLYVDSSGYLTYWVNGSARITASTAISIGSWNHVAVVRNSTTTTMYLNGTSVGTWSDSTNYATTAFIIGQRKDTASQSWLGNISNFRVVKGTAVYTANFTPSTTPLTAVSGTSLLTCQSNRFIDNSSNAFALTVNGTPSVQRFSPFNPTASYSTATIGGSGYFDGTGDYLTTSSSVGATSVTTTVEYWAYSTVNSNSSTAILGQNGTDFSVGVENDKPAAWLNTTLTIVSGFTNTIDGSSDNRAVKGTTSVSLNAWHHYAWVFSVGGSTTTCTLYVDGSSYGSFTFSNVGRTIGAIGAFAPGAGYPRYFNGYISNVRVTNSAVYTSSFTPSTTPLSAISNTQLLMGFTNAGIPDSAMMNDLETVGNAQVSTSVKKFGTGSISFDGTGDGLVAPASPNAVFGTGNFTIEWWQYWNSISGYQTIYSNNYISANNILVQTGDGTGKYRIFMNNSSPTLTETNAASTGQWYHYAIVRNGSTLTIYRDGTSNGSTTSSASVGVATVITEIGQGNNSFSLNAYIDDLRITKGYARYTTTFTPPTAALPTY